MHFRNFGVCSTSLVLRVCSKRRGEAGNNFSNYFIANQNYFGYKLNLLFEDKLVIVRYGHLWRGAKVLEATKRGAVGVIMFSDPADYASADGTDTRVFPDTVYLPGNGD